MPDEPAISQHAQGSYIAQATYGGTATVQVVLPPPAIQEQNRVRFLARLHALYDQLWEQSLQGASLLTLGLSEKPDAVLHHTGLLFLSPAQPERPLPAGTSIVQVYDQAGHELLILGEPGAGKSTLLLDLARQLRERAEQDGGHPLPLLVPLSSWAVKRQPLQDWLPAQLSLLYDVPLQLSRAWVLTDQVLPLLDGLDEVPQEARVACLEAITTYRKEHLVPLVVCSRRAEYEAIARQERLVLHNAVVVQPLSRQQVETYLEQAGSSLAAVRTVLRTNPGLQELTTTPLMLSVLTLTYTDARVHELPQRGSVEVQQQQVFAAYVERMVARKGNRVRYPLQRTRGWLGWLARQMRAHNQSVFYLEHLQPDWLAPRQYGAYERLAVGLPGILIGVLASLGIPALLASTLPNVEDLIQSAVLGGLLGGLFSGVSPSRASLSQQIGVYPRQGHGHVIGRRIAISILMGLLIALSFGLYLGNKYGLSNWLIDGSIYGVAIALSSLLLQFIIPSATQRAVSSRTGRKQRRTRLVGLMQTVHGQRALRTAAGVGLSYGLSGGLGYGLSVGLHPGLIAGVSFVLIFGLVYGLISVLVSVILEVQTEGIHLTERLQWTWNSLRRSLLTPKHIRTTLLLASTIAVIYGLLEGLSYALSGESRRGLTAGASSGLRFGLGIGLCYWIAMGLFLGISRERIEDRFRHRPNQGIRHSLSNSILMAIISGVGVWVISTLAIGLSYELRVGWFIGVCGGLLVCAMSGGLSTLRHFVIRLLLWRSHTFPWKAAQFLDDATVRILLRRVGGGYSFVHRLILDYFASLDTMPTESAVSPLSQAVPSRVCACGHLEERPEARFCSRCGKPLTNIIP